MPEPYAWRSAGGSIWNHKTSADDVPLYSGDQVRALAAVREPLSDEQIADCVTGIKPYPFDLATVQAENLIAFVRAIEAAHGVTAQAQQEGK